MSFLETLRGRSPSGTRPPIEMGTRKHVVAARRERKVRQYALEQIDGPGAPRRLALEKNEVVIGRASGVGIELASAMVSRYHALLTRRGTDYVLRDNDSQNGVFLNGVKIHSAVLREGDMIQTADCAFIYREG
jgi:pSer/pThr/pTyr-binding forkhead associated (FHA) protein